MINYPSGLNKIFWVSGSVFPKALLVALPCTFIAAGVKYLSLEGFLPFIQEPGSVLRDNEAFGGFSFLVGFLVVFRTSQAYSRFWEGSTATHRMRAEWFDACSSLIAFCRFNAEADSRAVSSFQNTLVRLFSMLHSCALAELEHSNLDSEGDDKIECYHFDVIDPGSFDSESLETLRSSSSKVELIFSWVQFLIVDNMSNKVLSIPPPILSRSFQEIANGMVAFHDALRIAHIPFPFPYAQTCDCLLIIHWLVVPFVMTEWVESPFWAGVFSFLQVAMMWALNFIATEIENPFGTDANDLDGEILQDELNRHLAMLLSKRTKRLPILIENYQSVEQRGGSVHTSNFFRAWRRESLMVLPDEVLQSEISDETAPQSEAEEPPSRRLSLRSGKSNTAKRKAAAKALHEIGLQAQQLSAAMVRTGSDRSNMSTMSQGSPKSGSFGLKKSSRSGRKANRELTGRASVVSGASSASSASERGIDFQPRLVDDHSPRSASSPSRSFDNHFHSHHHHHHSGNALRPIASEGSPAYGRDLVADFIQLRPYSRQLTDNNDRGSQGSELVMDLDNTLMESEANLFQSGGPEHQSSFYDSFVELGTGRTGDTSARNRIPDSHHEESISEAEAGDQEVAPCPTAKLVFPNWSSMTEGLRIAGPPASDPNS